MDLYAASKPRTMQLGDSLPSTRESTNWGASASWADASEVEAQTPVLAAEPQKPISTGKKQMNGRGGGPVSNGLERQVCQILCFL